MSIKKENRFNCYVLGRAQDAGVPHIGCTKECCKNARSAQKTEMQACLGVHDTKTNKLVLIEATPSIEKQVSLLHRLSGVTNKKPFIDALLMTHAHIGHYGGLLLLGKEAALTNKIPTFITSNFSKFLQGNAPWSDLISNQNLAINNIEPNTKFEPISDLFIEAIHVPHRKDHTDTVAFKIYGENKSVLFMPDIDYIEGHEHLIGDVDIAFIDGTFYDSNEIPNRSISTIPHPLICDTMNHLQEYAKKTPEKIRFIHFNHSNPALNNDEVQHEISSRCFNIAKKNEKIPI
ncbi:MAG TPA: pyrroloquinoline quinone biosynthesis protein PqqB [Opitutae bacterium]|nr:pyrroloquinoline quinone biosynthesis protein PqqB [Opitutae bacterium]